MKQAPGNVCRYYSTKRRKRLLIAAKDRLWDSNRHLPATTGCKAVVTTLGS